MKQSCDWGDYRGEINYLVSNGKRFSTSSDSVRVCSQGRMKLKSRDEWVD